MTWWRRNPQLTYASHKGWWTIADQDHIPHLHWCTTTLHPQIIGLAWLMGLGSPVFKAVKPAKEALHATCLLAPTQDDWKNWSTRIHSQSSTMPCFKSSLHWLQNTPVRSFRDVRINDWNFVKYYCLSTSVYTWNSLRKKNWEQN